MIEISQIILNAPINPSTNELNAVNTSDAEHEEAEPSPEELEHSSLMEEYEIL